MTLPALPDAIAHYHDAVRLEPGFPDAHNNLGATLVAAGKPDEGAAEYRAALKVAPGVLAEQGKCADAAEHYGEAARLRPADTGFVERQAWVLVTCGDARTRDARRAVTLAEHTCKTTEEKDPRKALTLARASGENAMATDLETRLASYERPDAERATARRK